MVVVSAISPPALSTREYVKERNCENLIIEDLISFVPLHDQRLIHQTPSSCFAVAALRRPDATFFS
jgi:hypothetical protein